MGSHQHRKKDGSNSNSSRTSPSKLEDSEFARNSLLASNDAEFDEEGAWLSPLSTFRCDRLSWDGLESVLKQSFPGKFSGKTALEKQLIF